MFVVIIALDPPEMERLLNLALSRLEEARSSMKRLSTAELEVITLLSNGLTQVEIAKKLVKGYTTVKAHTVNLRKKLGAKNVAQAVAIAKYEKII